jgi:hypothetical protein
MFKLQEPLCITANSLPPQKHATCDRTDCDSLQLGRIDTAPLGPRKHSSISSLVTPSQGKAGKDYDLLIIDESPGEGTPSRNSVPTNETFLGRNGRTDGS